MNQEKFVQSLFDERAPAYDSWVSGFWTAYRESVDRETARVLSETGSPVSVIDVGCGTASRLNRFLDAEPAGKFLRTVAMDISWGMIAEARKNLKGKPVRLFQGSAARLPVRSEGFDVVLMLYAVLGCLANGSERRAAFVECARILKPGGVMVTDVLSRRHRFYQDRPEVFRNAENYKKEKGWTWEEGDILIEVEKGKPSFNHGFEAEELKALTRGLFEKSDWRCYDTETGQAGDARFGHFFGVLRK